MVRECGEENVVENKVTTSAYAFVHLWILCTSGKRQELCVCVCAHCCCDAATAVEPGDLVGRIVKCSAHGNSNVRKC